MMDENSIIRSQLTASVRLILEGLNDFRKKGAKSHLGQVFGVFLALVSFSFTLWGLFLLYTTEGNDAKNLLSAISLLTLVAMVATFLTFWRRSPKLRDGRPDPTFLLVATAFCLWIVSITINTTGWKNSFLTIFLDVANSTIFLLATLFFEFGPNNEKSKASIPLISEKLLNTSGRVLGVGSAILFLALFFDLLAPNLKTQSVALYKLPLVFYNLLVIITLGFAMFYLYQRRTFTWLQRTLLPAVMLAAVVVVCSVLTPFGEQEALFENINSWITVLANFYRIGIGVLFLSLGFSFIEQKVKRNKEIIANTELASYHDHKKVLPVLYGRLMQIADKGEFDAEALRKLGKGVKSYAEINKLLYNVKKGNVHKGEGKPGLVKIIRKLEDLCKDLFEFTDETGRTVPRIKFKNDLPPEVEKQLDLRDEQLADIQRVLFELIMNADKHAYHELKKTIPGSIYITLMPEVTVGKGQRPRFVNLVVWDDGEWRNENERGMTVKDVEVINAHLAYKGDNEKKGDSTGWKVITAVTEYHGWKITFNGVIGKPAKFYIAIPLNAEQW